MTNAPKPTSRLPPGVNWLNSGHYRTMPDLERRIGMWEITLYVYRPLDNYKFHAPNATRWRVNVIGPVARFTLWAGSYKEAFDLFMNDAVILLPPPPE